MIDWYSLATNSLWVLACALALAGFSHASWQASLKRRKFSQQLSEPGTTRTLFLAALLFCLGLAGSADLWWEKVSWLLLGVFFTFQIITSLKRSQ